MKKFKRIAAIAAIVILIGMYIVSLIAALSSSEYAQGLFYASLFCTFFIPVIIYVIMLFYKFIHREKGISLRELRKMNKTYEKTGKFPDLSSITKGAEPSNSVEKKNTSV